MPNILKEKFLQLVSNYTTNETLSIALWNEIEQNYTGKKRHYHTLQHLENLWVQLNEVKDKIQHWELMLFTLFYHDIIYHPIKYDNEARSAQFAKKRMQQISVATELITLCKSQILATKSHIKSSNTDTNYFLDADLSVLGQDWESYAKYYENVRKEYSIFPDFVYKPGRKKVLLRFLVMERIFKTDYFFHKFELLAKQNLQKELEMLG
jgi:predicted metal-dependent HD superfamily phosphohydrolase